MKKLLILALVLLLCAIAVIIAAKNAIAKALVTRAVKAFTGLELEMRDLSVGIPNTLVKVEDLKILNPKGFSDSVMADLPLLSIKYDLPALLTKRVHLEEVRLHLKELTIIRNQNRELNLNSLKGAKELKQDTAEGASKEKKKIDFKIDNLELKIGKIVYKDYSSGAEPQLVELNLNIDRRFQDISDFQQLRRVILGKVLTDVDALGLVIPDFGAIKEQATKTIEATKGLVTGTVEGAAEAVKGLGETAEGAVKKTLGELKGLIQMNETEPPE